MKPFTSNLMPSFRIVKKTFKGNGMEFIKSRLTEPSTWRGLIWCLSAFGVYQFSGDQSGAITALGMALAGGAGFLPDKK